MAVFKCKMCGGTLEVSNETVAVCEYCGTKQTLPKTNDDVISNLFNRANNLRLKCEFDKAAAIYEKIVEQDDSEAEAHWGIVLCKYGIEYVEDPKTKKRIPTCHRTLFEAVTTDADYIAAVDYSDAAQQSIYESEARAIDKIQKDILSIVKNEKPFDVFICYKETDDNGKRTIDSAIANDIYYQLTQEGFKVFFAAITLEDKLGQEYEPYIFAALNSSKVMLVLGTKPEYFNAVWVKNEWSRFLQLMKTNHSKLLIPCYRDMDAYDLPEEFAHLQAQDMSKIGFINDVVRGIKKIAEVEAPQKTVVKETVVTQGNLNIAPLLKRAFMFLEDGDFASADEYAEKVLDTDPENATAYLVKLMAELNVKNQEDLKDCAEPFDINNNYQKTIRFGDSELKETISGYVEHIKTRNENRRLENTYITAVDKMAMSFTETSLNETAELFESIIDYKDAKALSLECYEKAEIARKDAILAEAKTLIANAIESCEKAITMFRSISGWKDADEQIIVCQKKIEEIKAQQEAERLEKERLAELRRQQAIERAKRIKKIAAITTPIVCVVIAFIIVLNTLIIPSVKYNQAVKLMENGEFDKARESFIELVDFKDSAEKLGDLRIEIAKEKLKTCRPFDYITFGACEQDNDLSNGKEDIKWIVLDKKDGKALVVSKYALDYKSFDLTETGTTWEQSNLREWLNDEFVKEAFTERESQLIPIVTVKAHANPTYSGANQGKDTEDKVFLLSVAEVNKYFASHSIMCEPTEYAAQKNGKLVYYKYSSWGLRTIGLTNFKVAYVSTGGAINSYGSDVNDNNTAVRPAMWIDISKVE